MKPLTSAVFFQVKEGKLHSEASSLYLDTGEMWKTTNKCKLLSLGLQDLM